MESTQAPPQPPPHPPYALPFPPALIASPADLADAAALLLRAPVIGMDCEWGPDPAGGGRPAKGRRPARYAPVETLQLATADAAFVLDLRVLVGLHGGGGGGRGGRGAPSPLTPAEAALEALLAGLCSRTACTACFLTGHSLRGDLARLAATLPGLPVFGGGGGGGGGVGRPAPLSGHVDLVLLARAASDASPPVAGGGGGLLAGLWPTPSLASLTATHLGAFLDKSARRSDWSARPLTDAQLAYAAADAHVCVALFEALAGGREWGDEGGGVVAGGAPRPSAPAPAAAAAAALAASPRWCAFLANGVRDAAGGRGGGSPAPARPTAGPGSGVPRRERARVRERRGAARAGAGAPAVPPPHHHPRPPPAKECEFDVPSFIDAWLGVPLPATGGRAPVLAAVAGLLVPGEKDASALEAAVRAAPPTPRGGVVETASACMLLVNFQAASYTGGGPPRLYTNAFSESDDGVVLMSWWPAPGQGPGARTIKRLLDPATPVLLFARLTGVGKSGSSKGAYTCLGRLAAASVDWEAACGGGEVAWRLVDVAASRRRGGQAVASILAAGGLLHV